MNSSTSSTFEIRGICFMKNNSAEGLIFYIPAYICDLQLNEKK